MVPVTLMIIFLLLYLNFRRSPRRSSSCCRCRSPSIGGMWLMWWLGFNMSVAVAVGFIALAGVAAETGVIMLIYLDHAAEEIRERCREEGRPYTRADLYQAIMIGAVERVRPKMMTVVAIMAGLLAHHVEHGHRLRGHAAHRRADDRRHGLVDAADPHRHSGHLRHCQRLAPAARRSERKRID